jgi:hypothetical protein
MLAVSKNPPKLLRIVFYNTNFGSLFDKLVHKIVSAYTRVFGYSGFVTHCGVQLGSHYYEVAMDGCFHDVFDECLLESEHVVGWYEIDLDGVNEDSLLAARFMLDYDVRIARSFDWKSSLRYLKNYVCQGIKNYDPIVSYLDYSLKSGTIKLTKSGIAFNLPFTCATQVSNVVNQLFKLEPALDCHLPEALLFYLKGMAQAGFGSFVLVNELNDLMRH